MRNTELAPLSIFYGYPPELIARWCGVSIATARRWKRGGAAPRPALRIFTLYRDGKVLDEHWKGWRAIKGRLVDPDGISSTQGQLAAYCFVMQWAAGVAREDPKRADEFQDLLKRA